MDRVFCKHTTTTTEGYTLVYDEPCWAFTVTVLPTAPSLPPAPVKGPSNPAIKDTGADGAEGSGGGDSP